MSIYFIPQATDVKMILYTYVLKTSTLKPLFRVTSYKFYFSVGLNVSHANASWIATLSFFTISILLDTRLFIKYTFVNCCKKSVQTFWTSKYFQRTLEDFQAGIIPYSQQAPVVTGTSKRKSESSLDSQSSEWFNC